jgi:subtilisin family serine protease
MSHNWNEAFDKNARFECLESRIVMSAHGLTNFATIDLEQTVADQIQTTSVTLNQVHQQTGVQQIHQEYGFQGHGQTVVVIDSGIAWDHYALGGGYGSGYRVVGGWDFAQNDADPFDSGSAGFHGTHVAGIIGSSDANNLGVASGVDLVALRVFDDNGHGSLEHVRQALAWVNSNLHSFVNPITTVNLSLGTNWNANEIPFWANLEAEFAALESRGVFISVAAGNSFQQFQSVGVSYPAASSHVVPVASHGSSGQMSSFSQRNENVLVAPGESIRSTVPGHLFGEATSTRFLAASGTSMAAPYVAGGSVLLRQAMQFMGHEDIDQTTIYQRLRETADRVFDTVTGLTYHHINLRAAMESVVVDQHGDSLETATDLGILQGGERLAGTIGTFNDQDFVRFTAGRTGTLTLNFQQTHDLNLSVHIQGQPAQWVGNSLTLDVVAGQEYTLLLETTNGIGHYTIDSSIQLATLPTTDLGTIFSRAHALQNSSTQWYELTAGRTGILALQLDTTQGQPTAMQLFDTEQRWLGTAMAQGDQWVLQANVQAGQSLLLRIDGDLTAALTLQNLVSFHNGTLTVNGTNQSNQIEVRDGASVVVTIDQVAYSFNRTDLQRVQVYAHGGQNHLDVIQDQHGNQTAHLHRHHIYVFNSSYVILGHQVHTISYHGHAQDQVRLFDTADDDTFTARQDHSELQGAGYHNQVFGVGRVVAVASGGNDRANIQGTTGNDQVYSNSAYTTLTANQYWTLARGFEELSVDGGGGQDRVAAFGSQSNESLLVQTDFSRFESADLSREFSGFRNQQFFAVGGGGNSAVLQGGSSPNTFDAYWNRAFFSNTKQVTYLAGFQNVTAVGNHSDRAILYDSIGNDTFDGHGGWGRMMGHGYQNQAVGFGLTIARFSSGSDLSQLYNIQPGVTTTQQTDRATVIYPDQFEVRSVGGPPVSLSVHSFGQVPNPTSLAVAPAPPSRSWLPNQELAVRVMPAIPLQHRSDWAIPSGLHNESTAQRPGMTAAPGLPTAAEARHHQLGPPQAIQAAFAQLGSQPHAVVYLQPAAESSNGDRGISSRDRDIDVAAALNDLLENELVDLWFTAQGS